jgi:CubicO group peptidase (beta-lactamase class C family)
MKNIFKLLVLVLVLASQSLFAQNIQSGLSVLFDTLHARRNFDGCVLVAKDGKVVFEKAYGLADEENARPLTITSVFELASVSKQFTALAIMQLKEKGLLDYSDSIQKFLPDLPYKDVTVRDLLVHSAGIPDFMHWDERELNFSKINTNADILKKLPTKYPEVTFIPGSQFSYSNTNYLLLACIVEKLSGLTFADYMEKNVFQPAGMLDTRVYSRHSAAKKIENYALGYFWDPQQQKFVNMDIVAPYSYYLDGVAGPYGISSNVYDLLKWDQALYTNKLISQDNLKEAFKPSYIKGSDKVLSTPMGINAGFGWEIIPDPSSDKPDMFHSGGYGGYSNLIVRNTGRKETVILLSNHKEMVDVFSIMSTIDEILNSQSPAMPDRVLAKKSVQNTVAQLKEYTGNYAIAGTSDHRYLVRIKADRLFINLPGQFEVPVYMESADTFLYTEMDAKIKFGRDQNGKISTLTFLKDGQQASMVRVD